MAVFKKRICPSCNYVTQDAKEKKVPGPCAKCGEPTKYSEKWYVAVYVTGEEGTKLIRRAVSKYKAEAQAEEAALLKGRSEGDVIVARDKTSFVHVSVIFEDWLSQREADGKMAASTAQYYRMRLNAHLLPAFTGCDVKNIDHDAAQRYVNMRRQTQIYGSTPDKPKYPTPADINRDLATLKRMLSVAVLKKLIRHNPLEGYELLPENNKRERFLTEQETDLLLAECEKPKYPAHLLPIVMIGLETGLRKDGVLAMKWSDVDFAKREIKRTVKGGRVVRIPMTNKLHELLSAWQVNQKIRSINNYVFPSPKKPSSHMLITSRFGFEWACKEAGLEGFTFHDLRHTFATRFIGATRDIHTLAQLLGHSTTHITERYAHLLDEVRVEAMRKFEEG